MAKLTKKQARAWAIGLIAADIECNLDNGCYDLEYDNPHADDAVKIAALKELAKKMKVQVEKMGAKHGE
jgi:hypothetical protein